MSRMSNIVFEIEEMLIQGLNPEQIAESLSIPIEWVFEAENILAESTEPSDGFISDTEADAHALASAGWGTDEDYILDNDYFDDSF